MVLQKKSRLRVKGIKVKDKEKIKEAIAISIQKGNYTTREIGLDIGKDHSTVSRYLSEMEDDPKWSIKRDTNGGIPGHIKAQIAKSVHVRFDAINLGYGAAVQGMLDRPF